MAQSSSDSEFLSPREFACLSGVSEVTVRRYLKAGHISYAQPSGPRGRILIPRCALKPNDLSEVELTPDDTDHAAIAPETPVRGTISGPTPKWMKPRSEKKEE